jgi:hypothetical protein
MRFLPSCMTSMLIVAAVPMPAAAQMADASPACTAPADLPEGLASWRNPVAIKAAADKRGAASVALTPGQAVTMALLQTPQVSYALRPAKPGGSVSYGGMARFTVKQAGTWRVALGSGAWVDVVKGKEAMTSVAHGHGPDCSGIRKMVDYSLQPGTYLLQISANGSDSLPVLVTRLP